MYAEKLPVTISNIFEEYYDFGKYDL